MHQSEVYQCLFIVAAPSIVLLSLSFIRCIFTVSMVSRDREQQTDADDEALSIFPDVCSWLTVETINLLLTHAHAHISPLNAYSTANSQPTLSHYTWKLAPHDHTLYGLSCLPDALSISLPFFLLLPGGWEIFLSRSPPPVPLNHCFPVMHLFV